MKQAGQEKVADPNAALRQRFEKWANDPSNPFAVDDKERACAWSAWKAAQPSPADLEKLAREIAKLPVYKSSSEHVLQLLTSTMGTK